MNKSFQLELSPELGMQESELQAFLGKKFQLPEDEIVVRLQKRSIDARSRNIKVLVQGEVYYKQDVPALIDFNKDSLPEVSSSPSVIIVGSGPAGLFAAIQLIELGIKPILIERGKDVRARRWDLAAINKHQEVNPESNYCFGEGGAGTYSDGKLYTRSVKRGNLRRVLEILVDHQAKSDILYESHPHIGTNKLPDIVSSLRQTIIDHGGEVHFNAKMEHLLLKQDQCYGIQLTTGERIEAHAVILATGHSARDVFEMLHNQNVHIEAKPFALGLRIEHPQSIIDEIQYHCNPRPELLPASSYALVEQVAYKGDLRGVFSFCMCPGGFIVPAATAPGEIVVNGMSPSRRNSKFANSGMVVAVELSDIPDFSQYGPLATLKFQQMVEQAAFKAASGGQHAPAQRMVDFVEKKVSSDLNTSSYQPGLSSVSLDEVLPAFIAQRLREAFVVFGKKKRGYLTNEANLVGVESRTSSPVRIPRNPETLEHVQIKGLYPCGEGAGYAGGILSAAMDGERVAVAVAAKLQAMVTSSSALPLNKLK